MAKQLIPGRQVNLGADTSNLTGRPFYVGDAELITISIQSSHASASRYTVVGTNQDGFQAALTTPSMLVPANNWSIVTAIVGQGLFKIDAGMRWLNCFRDAIQVSASSNATITFATRT